MIPIDVALILIGLLGSGLVVYALDGFPVIKKTIKEFIAEFKRG